MGVVIHLPHSPCWLVIGRRHRASSFTAYVTCLHTPVSLHMQSNLRLQENYKCRHYGLLTSQDIGAKMLMVDYILIIKMPAKYLGLFKPAAAAAKPLQSCPTLCDPIDGSPPGSPVPGILQASILEWVVISFSNAGKWKVKVKSARY